MPLKAAVALDEDLDHDNATNNAFVDIRDLEDITVVDRENKNYNEAVQKVASYLTKKVR